MKTSPRVPLLFACSLLLCLPAMSGAETPAKPARKEALKAELAKMEDAFCAMAKEKGILAAFECFATPDVAFVDTDPRQYRGLEAVRKRMGPDRPGTSLTWSALFTDVSDDGTLGYNYGRYELRAPGSNGTEVVRTGFSSPFGDVNPTARGNT